MAARNNYCAQLVALLLCCLIAVISARQAPEISTGDAAPGTKAPDAEKQAMDFMEGLASATGYDADYIKESAVRHDVKDAVHDGDVEGFEYICKNITAEEAETLSKDTEEPLKPGTEMCEMQQKKDEGGRFINIKWPPILTPPGNIGCKIGCTGTTAAAVVGCSASPVSLPICIPAVMGALGTCSACPDILCHAPVIQTATSLMCKATGCYKLPGALQGPCNTICNFCKLPSIKPPTNPGKTCSGACGGKSKHGCWCDSLCTKYNDCCPDKKAKCG